MIDKYDDFYQQTYQGLEELIKEFIKVEIPNPKDLLDSNFMISGKVITLYLKTVQEFKKFHIHYVEARDKILVVRKVEEVL